MIRKLVLFIFVLLLMAATPLLAMDKININKASAQELEQLKGVGPKIAQKIIEYRDKNGPFKKPEDIKLVQGIGPKILEDNKEMLTVDDTAAMEPKAADAKATKAPTASPAPVNEKSKTP